MKCIVKIICLPLLLSVLNACSTATYPPPEPYVAVKGKPYYWYPTASKHHMYDCSALPILKEGEEHGYTIEHAGCRVTHDGNFSPTDLKGVSFYIRGLVPVDYVIPSFGPFGFSSHGLAERTYKVTIKVLEENDPALAKCKRVNYQELENSYYRYEEYVKNAVAYDCYKR